MTIQQQNLLQMVETVETIAIARIPKMMGIARTNAIAVVAATLKTAIAPQIQHPYNNKI